MFKITPIQSPELQKDYAEAVGTVAREGFFAYSMLDAESGALMGFSQFEIRGEDGYITDLFPAPDFREDMEAMFILGRATMNFIDMCGAHVCYSEKSAADARLLHAIGFREERDGLLFADMTDMFSGHCDGDTVKLD